MTEKSSSYINRLKNAYSSYGDNDSLLALAEIEKADERVRELRIYREQSKTQELIKGALMRYKNCIEKLTGKEGLDMSDMERAECFATMDWCKFTLDIVGENPDQADAMVEQMVENYARKSGVIAEL